MKEQEIAKLGKKYGVFDQASNSTGNEGYGKKAKAAFEYDQPKPKTERPVA